MNGPTVTVEALMIAELEWEAGQEVRVRKYNDTAITRGSIRIAIIDPVRRRVFHRYGWRCHICGQPIPRIDRREYRQITGRAANAWLGQIDHVIPLDAGGTNEMSNLAPAHAYCNSVKHNYAGCEITFYEDRGMPWQRVVRILDDGFRAEGQYPVYEMYRKDADLIAYALAVLRIE